MWVFFAAPIQPTVHSFIDRFAISAAALRMLAAAHSLGKPQPLRYRAGVGQSHPAGISLDERSSIDRAASLPVSRTAASPSNRQTISNSFEISVARISPSFDVRTLCFKKLIQIRMSTVANENRRHTNQIPNSLHLKESPRISNLTNHLRMNHQEIGCSNCRELDRYFLSAPETALS